MLKSVLAHKEFIFGLMLTLMLLWPLFVAPYFSHHDDVQVIRLFEMNKCFTDYQIPCRWVPDLGGLYGYPIFNYYAPLPYYFGEAIYFLSKSLLISAKSMFAVSFVGAYIFMFLLASKLWGKKGALIAALFYSFAPYHALDFYVRGAMGEMWALMFFPAVLWSITKLEEKLNVANLLISAMAVAALIVSHNLSAMIFFPIFLFWILLIFWQKKKFRFIWYSFFALMLGLMISAFYFLPALSEKDLVHVDSTTSGYFSYTEHFKGLRKLFFERSFGYGSSIREVPGGERDGLSYQIGWAHLIGLLLALFTAKVLWKKDRILSLIIIFSTLVIVLSVFMIHPRSLFVWKSIEPLKYLQFPWRFLIIIIFFISLISGSIFLLEFKNKKLLWYFLIIAVVFLNFSYFRPEKFIETNDSKRLSGKDWDTQIKRSIFDYLPIYAKEPPAELATVRYQILTGDSQIYDYYEGTNWISLKTKTNTHTIIRLSQYYFPDWKVYIDGKETVVDYKNNSLGLMTFILGKGNHTIEARLFDTQIRSLSNTITLSGFAISLILFLISFQSVRSWMAYYRKRIN